jgi:hypothetical protein
MRAVGPLILLSHFLHQIAALGALSDLICGVMDATVLAYMPMATGTLEIPVRHGSGEHEGQRPGLDNKDLSTSTNGIQVKQQECPLEPFLCSNEECGGHVIQGIFSLILKKSQADKHKDGNYKCKTTTPIFSLCQCCLIVFLPARISSAELLRLSGMDTTSNRLCDANLNHPLAINVN